MRYLYGDSTPSHLTSNFLEFLRDAIDFGVFALHVDDEIALIRERVRVTEQAAADEVARLDALGGAVAGSISEAPKGADDSETSRCAAHLAATSAETVALAIVAVRERLDAQRAELGAEEATQREACFKAIESLLLAHSPPESRVSVRIERGSDRGYTASRQGETPFGLAWRVDLAIPAGNAFSGDAPMEKLAAHFEIHAPEQTGWLKKEVKLKAQRLDRFVLTEAVDDGTTLTIKLRADAAGSHGIDLAVAPEVGRVSATRAAPDDDPSAGPFEPSAEEVQGLVGLAERVRAAAGELTATRLTEALLREAEIRQEPAFARLVEQLVSAMAPIVQDVARHSLTSTELVLRRLLSSERREEIFVAKSTLREKFMPLRPDLRALFGRLGLDTLPPPRPPSIPAPEESEWPPARAELPRSEPPPPLDKPR